MWRNMMRRCYNKKDLAYHNYGGRGIKVYKPWHDYDNFRKDILKQLGPRPPKMDLDRKDNNKGYRPSNVRWLSRKKNTGNKRTNLTLKFKGKTLTLSQYYALTPRRVSYILFRDRFLLGWKRKFAITMPLGHRWPKNSTQHLRGH